MRALTLGLAASMVLGLAPVAAPASAQQVRGSVSVRSGPVSSTIVFGRPGYFHRPYAYYPRRAYVYRPPIVVYRAAPRVLVVHRVWRPCRCGGWYWGRNGYRGVRVWYDRDHDRYYDRWTDGRAGLRQVTVYERGGAYYRDRDDD